MAPPRKPSEVHRRNGSYKEHPARENKHEPKPEAGRPAIPLSVQADPVALACWENVCLLCEGMGIISTADLYVIEEFALSYACFQDSIKTCREQGNLIEGGRGVPIRNPARIEANQQMLLLNRLGSKLGLSPSDRAGMTTTKEETDPFTDYMKQMQEANN